MTGTTAFREHPFWDALNETLSALEQIDSQERTAAISEVLEVLKVAKGRRKAPAKIELYRDLLDAMQQSLQYLSTSYIANGSYVSQFTAFRTQVRQLPEPPRRELAQSYQTAIDDAAKTSGQFLESARAQLDSDLIQYRQDLSKLTGELEELNDRLSTAGAEWEENVQAAEVRATQAEELINETATEAVATFESKWTEAIGDWKDQARREEREHTAAFNIELATLATAAQVGQRLLEHAAGTLTAHTWTGRASRERRSGNITRALAVIGLLGAVVVGYLFTREALVAPLSVGQSTLRVSVVGALGALGAYLMAESRRHFREASSAEEVSTVIEQMEPFLEGSEFREDVRRQVSDTVFVRNVVSRFAQRDGEPSAPKQLSELDMMSILKDLTTAVQELNKATKGSVSGS